ncbi:MAG: hypothetical protein LBR79_00570 [Oscillospiraceae bacterium]|jgi:hypothetical protein|nr:hypothetical protein [Oscillospiraceae bacterium]
MKKSVTRMYCSIISVLAISQFSNLLHATNDLCHQPFVNPQNENETPFYLDEKTDKVVDLRVKPGMPNLSHLNRAIEISNKKSGAFFCSKCKKEFFYKIIDLLFEISDSFGFASCFNPYHHNLGAAQVIVSQLQTLFNIMNSGSKYIPWSVRSTALGVMHEWFYIESILPGLDLNSGEVGADDISAYLQLHYQNNDSIMNFIQSLTDRMEIFYVIIDYM